MISSSELEHEDIFEENQKREIKICVNSEKRGSYAFL